MTESSEAATAAVEDVTVMTESDQPAPAEGAVLDAAGPVDYDGLAIKVALGLKQVHQIGDNVAFMLVHPNLFDGLTAALQAMPDEAFPQLFKEQLGIYPDEGANPVRIVTQTDLEGEFLQQYFTANGLLPKLQHAMQNSMSRLRIGGQEQDIPNPVRVTLETLRVLFVLDLKERLAPGILRPPMGSQVVQGLLRK